MTISDEVVAWAMTIYESVKEPAWRAMQSLGFRLARLLPEDNLWLLEPTPNRLTYPFCCTAMIRALLAKEKATGKRADWLLWLEDDVIPPPDIYEKLRDAADPRTRPFVSAVGYCRTKPYGPGVVNGVKDGDRILLSQWKDVPQHGVIPVDYVGLYACIIHRSLFDIVPEPWFAILPPTINGSAGPDILWSNSVRRAGFQPYLCCDVEVGHIGSPVIVTRKLSEEYNKLGDYNKCHQ